MTARTQSSVGRSPLLAQPGAEGLGAVDDVRCPVPVDHPVMFHRWRRLTFLHWPFPPDDVQRLLPPGLAVDIFDGHGWVGLIPFHLHIFTGREVVGAGFPEANVRTYVVGPDGTRGIWFLSLDASRVDAVLMAHVTHSLPYRWARMTATERGCEATYTGARVWPRGRDASLHARIEIGDTLEPAKMTAFDRFSTARFCFYAWRRGRLMRAWADHDPWRLRNARVLELRETLLAAAGLHAPKATPLARYAEGVDVRIGRLHDLGSRHRPGRTLIPRSDNPASCIQ